MPRITVPAAAASASVGESAFRPWFDKLELLKDQPADWTPDCGPFPNKEVFRTARQFLECLCRNGKEPSRLSRSVVGGLGVTFKGAGLKVYVELSNKGTVHALFSDGSTDPRVEEVVPDDAGFSTLISRIRAYLHE